MVVARSDQVGAVPAEGDAEDDAGVSGERVEPAAAGNSPEPGRAVVAGGGNQPAVGAEDGARQPRERPECVEQAAAGGVPEAGRSVAGSGEDQLAVRAEADGK